MLRGDESSFVNVQSPAGNIRSSGGVYFCTFFQSTCKQYFTGLMESSNSTIPLPTCTTDLYAVRVPLAEIQSFRKMSSAMGKLNYSLSRISRIQKNNI